MASVFDEYIKMGEEKGAAKKEIEINERVAKDMLKEKMPLETIKRILRLCKSCFLPSRRSRRLSL